MTSDDTEDDEDGADAMVTKRHLRLGMDEGLATSPWAGPNTAPSRTLRGEQKFLVYGHG